MINHERVREGITKLEEGMRILSSGPLPYTLQKLTAAQGLLLNRFAPFKVGDRVKLKRAPEILNEMHGWWFCRHFLVKGATGTVRESDCTVEGQLVFDVEIDNQTRHDLKGELVPLITPYTYRFREESLELVK